MKLRDLTDKQQKDLMAQCDSSFKLRCKTKTPEERKADQADYRIAFSDGVRSVLEMIDKLP